MDSTLAISKNAIQTYLLNKINTATDVIFKDDEILVLKQWNANKYGILLKLKCSKITIGTSDFYIPDEIDLDNKKHFKKIDLSQ